jgi:hypothetical protein
VRRDVPLTAVQDARATLADFESALDPAHPTARAGAEVVGYGEVSTVLRLAALPGYVCKRMAGFRDGDAAEHYLAVVACYLDVLRAHGIEPVETRPVALALPRRRPVVYLVQPALDSRGFASEILRAGDDARLLACLNRVLAHVRTLIVANRRSADGRMLTVDAQLSNWHFADADMADRSHPERRHAQPASEDTVDAVRRQAGTPRLVDVGTPFMRLHGVDEIGVELFLAPVPPPFRSFSRWQRDVERYIDDYFDPRTLLLDLLGNFHKEGRPDRIPLARAHVNRWLAADGAELAIPALAAAEVDRYYRRDARKLELFLRLRRLDRWVRTRVLRQRYDFILPGPIQR